MTSITWTETSVTFSWLAPNPNPPSPVPVPVPVPPAPVPTPVPVLSGHVWALAIYDPAVVLPAAQQAALWSPTLVASSLVQDVSFQAYSVADPAVSSWVPHLTVKPPALLFVQKSPAGQGVLAYQTALPASEAEILTLVHKVRGK